MFRLIDSARRRALACLAVGALSLLLPRMAETKNCEVGSPAFGVEQGLWGTLKPVDEGQLPNERDSSNYNGTQRPDDVVYRTPLFTSVEIENGWIFQSYTQGLKIWDATGANAVNPVLTVTRDCQGSGFLRCLPGQHELRELFWDVDAPDGNDSVLALASAPLGLMIFDTTSKGNPRQAYQDYNLGIFQVWSATIGGKHWAFAATEGATNNDALGVRLYDMSAGLLQNGCIDEPEAQNCPGVRRGRVGTARAVSYLDGFRRSDGQFFIASTPGGRGGLEIFNVTNPLAAPKVATLFSEEFTYGTAIWEQGGKQFLALQYILPGGAGQGGRIYDISNCLNGSCGGLAPIWEKTWSVGAARHFVTYSKSGNKHFLYFGNEDKCSGGLQREWLIDVSNLAAGVPPTDLTPPQRIPVTANNETATVDYWSWYYAANPKGFSEVMPRMGKVAGNYFYRAAWTIFDIHEITGGVPPTADFTWSPAEIYPDTPVTFTSNSPGATEWNWTFPNGSASGASVVRTFSNIGAQAVTLNVSNLAGPGTPATKNVTVLNPAPVVTGGTASPTTARVCQPITFTATGVTGKPPLTFSWQIQNASNGMPIPATLSGSNPVIWDTTGISPGTYRAIPTVSNSTSSATLPAGNAPTMTLEALSPLPANGSFSPTNDPFPASTVQFHADVAGATSWRWDFGDGTPQVWSNDPIAGPNPLHTYTALGPKVVKVEVDNCIETERVSATLDINISVINPLVINGFAAACNFNPCEFVVSTPVGFTVEVSGDPTGYQFDWNGDGDYDDPGEAVSPTLAQPVTHTYTATTSSPIAPRLKILRGSEFKEQAVLTPFRVVAGGPPPPPPPPAQITISGPTSGQANQALSYSAQASNCTPVATWNWSASGGGVVTGNTTSVAITWPSDGPKTVSATNSGCSGATGTRNVQIGGGGNPSGLGANFTYSPASPQAGQAVSFDASSSTGAPTVYSWNFGDNQTGTGATASHTYAAPGTYTVRLDVSKPGCPDQLLGLCTAATTKSVVIGGGPPPFQADFTSTAECISEFGVNQCTAEKGRAVQFTANAPGATSFSWTFGDGGTAAGAQVSHTWTQPGSYEVRLTASNGQSTAVAARRFVIIGDPTPAKPKSVVLPWIAQTRGALLQSSDLYVHNPGAAAMEITLEFRKRGAPETSPPRATRTIQPGATLYVGDVLRELFSRENVAGFISVTAEKGDAEPVITSFNTTFQDDGRQFGQTVPGVSMGSDDIAASTGPGANVLHLVGLIDNSERLAYFGISNPEEEPATYHLRFFDKTGRQIGESDQDFTLSRFGQRQFQVQEIRDEFGVTNADDYRIEIEKKAGGQIVPYASNLRLSSEDPSFIGAGGARSSKVYLVGALSTPGLNNSLWQSDVLLSNVGSQAVNADITFTSIGVNSNPTAPVRVTLQPGQTERLENVIGGRLGIDNAIGVLTIASTSPGGVFPIVQGESYDNSDPTKRFGQSMRAVSDADAAGAGKKHLLVGLRQDAENRTTFWIFNPDSAEAEYDVVYRALNGTVLGTTTGVRLGPGKMRQFSPGQHPLPAAGVDDGFTVQVVVKSGKALSAAQVINNVTNDPAYIQGEVR